MATASLDRASLILTTRILGRVRWMGRVIPRDVAGFTVRAERVIPDDVRTYDAP